MTAEIRGCFDGRLEVQCASLLMATRYENGKVGGQFSGDERTLFLFTVLQPRHVDMQWMNRRYSAHMIFSVNQQHKKQGLTYFEEM